MKYIGALFIFTITLAFIMQGYGWSLEFPLLVIPLAYSFFALYFYSKQIFPAKKAFFIVLGMLIVFNISNYIAYLVNTGWYYNDYESQIVSLYIAGFQVLVYSLSQLLFLGLNRLYRKFRNPTAS